MTVTVVIDDSRLAGLLGISQGCDALSIPELHTSPLAGYLAGQPTVFVKLIICICQCPGIAIGCCD